MQKTTKSIYTIISNSIKEQADRGRVYPQTWMQQRVVNPDADVQLSLMRNQHIQNVNFDAKSTFLWPTEVMSPMHLIFPKLKSKLGIKTEGKPKTKFLVFNFTHVDTVFGNFCTKMLPVLTTNLTRQIHKPQSFRGLYSSVNLLKNTFAFT